MQWLTRIHGSMLGKIILEKCDAIYHLLGKEYLKTSNSVDEWLQVAAEFQHHRQFPNCLGAIDEKHVNICPPLVMVHYFYNYKGNHSVVLMVVANANYEVIYADVHVNGRVSDGRALVNCSLTHV